MCPDFVATGCFVGAPLTGYLGKNGLWWLVRRGGGLGLLEQIMMVIVCVGNGRECQK